jgi:stearoyl-CoA desaturase (Delta-9 desaturase)
MHCSSGGRRVVRRRCDGEIQLSPTARGAFRSKNLASDGAARGPEASSWSAGTLHDIFEHAHEPAAGPSPDDVEPASHLALHRLITGLVTAVPVLGLGFVAWQVWGDWLHRSDLIVLAIMYVVTGLGVTVGFHRLFTHRSFKTTRPIRALLAIAGSMAIEGPIVAWVADHRKHHAFSDRLGDPHSPHVEHGHGLKGALRGLAHAHVGWLFVHEHRGRRIRYAPDLLQDPLVSWVDRRFLVWALAGFAIPFGLGVAIGGSVLAGLSGMLWGGLVRVLLLHHVTYSINSLCHYFGRQPFLTGDESRNLGWLAPLTFGEAWHNGHHAFPTSARHGLQRGQLDISATVITLLERLGLAWDVVRIDPAKLAAKQAAA